MLERVASIRSRIGENMEDRYLFKAKRVDNGEWVQGALLLHDADTATIFNQHPADGSLQGFEVDRNTACQCTGLKDKNGNLIWENDIVNCLAEECCGYIGWNEDEAGFYFNVLLEDGTYEEEHIYDYVDCMDVIGNVFDNPELLGRNDE
jgi:uncharacterized phage protein (TIGR01671 family)